MPQEDLSFANPQFDTLTPLKQVRADQKVLAGPVNRLHLSTLTLFAEVSLVAQAVARILHRESTEVADV